MKLTALIDHILAEASAAAEQAHKLGLKYAGYGRYYDPKSGTRDTVAQTIDGKLVKVNPDSTPGGAPAVEPSTNATPSAAVAGTAPSGEERSDGYGDEVEPSEPQEPMMDSGLGRLLAAAGGDSMKLRKHLVKKFRTGDTTAKKWLDRLDTYDAEQKTDIQNAIQAVRDRQAADLATKKAKYNALYPPVNI